MTNTSSTLLGAVGLDKRIMMCVLYDGVVQSSSVALKIFCASPLHPSPPEPSVDTDLSPVSIALHFPCCRGVESHSLLFLGLTQT